MNVTNWAMFCGAYAHEIDTILLQTEVEVERSRRLAVGHREPGQLGEESTSLLVQDPLVSKVAHLPKMGQSGLPLSAFQPSQKPVPSQRRASQILCFLGKTGSSQRRRCGLILPTTCKLGRSSAKERFTRMELLITPSPE